MRLEGTVMNIKESGLAMVEVASNPECAKCGGCFGKGGGRIEVPAENGLNAKVGDRVVVETSQSNVITASLILFIVPLLALAAGYFLFRTLFGTEWTAILGAFIFIGLSFLGIGAYERLSAGKRSCNFKVAEVIGK